MSTEPTLAALLTAAEAARTANHEAPTAPRTTTSVYVRIGALVDLLAKVDQLASVLAEHVQALVDDPALRADDRGNAPGRAVKAAALLRHAAALIEHAGTKANDAWSHTGSLYLDASKEK